MTEKHEWVNDDLCLIEKSTGIRLYGTVSTDMSFIANQLNMSNQTIIRLENENKELEEKVEGLTNLLKELGLLRTDEEVIDIRTEIADKLIKPLFKANGFDVDVDCTDGITIIPKEED